MGNRNSIIVTMIGIITLLVVITGATFAYFSADSTSETQTITTSSLNLTIETNGTATHVTNIKPTIWSPTMNDNINNEDITKIPFKVTSTDSVNGNYVVKLGTASPITLNADDTLNGGEISDIKYRVYTKNGMAVGTVGSFSTDMSIPANYSQIITGNLSSTLNEEYIIYVYIENKQDSEQNQLQSIDFTVSITGSAKQF